MERGELVPDELLLDLVREALEVKPSPPGLVLDGYPRNLAQAESLSHMLNEMRIQVGGVLNLQVAPGVLVGRLRKRATLENRADDSDETVQHRLEVYEKLTAPLVDYYRARGLLRQIDGEGTVDEVQSRVFAVSGVGSAGQGGPAFGTEQ